MSWISRLKGLFRREAAAVEEEADWWNMPGDLTDGQRKAVAQWMRNRSAWAEGSEWSIGTHGVTRCKQLILEMADAFDVREEKPFVPQPQKTAIPDNIVRKLNEAVFTMFPREPGPGGFVMQRIGRQTDPAQDDFIQDVRSFHRISQEKNNGTI